MLNPMSNTTIELLLRKRGELLASAQGIQSAIYHLDQTLALIGYTDENVVARGRRFANGELIALIGEAERSGHKTVTPIVQYVMSAKGMDLTDERLRRKIIYSVKECRKRTSPRG